MLTLLEVGNHLDMSESNAGSVCRKLGVDWKSSSLDVVRVAYIRDIRATAAGRAVDGNGLNDARARESLLKGDKLEMEIARDAGQLVDADEMEQEWCEMTTAARVELAAMSTGLQEKIKAEYGVDIPRKLIDEYIDRSLDHLAQAGGRDSTSSADQIDEDMEEAGEIINNDLGE